MLEASSIFGAEKSLGSTLNVVTSSIRRVVSSRSCSAVPPKPVNNPDTIGLRFKGNPPKCELVNAIEKKDRFPKEGR